MLLKILEAWWKGFSVQGNWYKITDFSWTKGYDNRLFIYLPFQILKAVKEGLRSAIQIKDPVELISLKNCRLF